MNITQATEKFIEILKVNQSLSAQELSDQSGSTLLFTYKVLKLGVEDCLFNKEENEDSVTYSLNLSSSKSPSRLALADSRQNKGKDFSKYIFNGIPYSKGQCAYQVINSFIKQENATYDDLKASFPDEIIQKFGVTAKVEKAKELSPKQPRYFLKDTQIIKTSDGIDIAVCNQWTLERFEKFIDKANERGYLILKEVK